MSIDTNAPPRRYLLRETNFLRLRGYGPNVAILPWGATEAHNYHLPYTTDVIEATSLAERAADLADARGARIIVLPTVPFGNNEMQLDQVATVSITTVTAGAILDDVVRSLCKQGMNRLVILNAHGGNDLKPLVRDVRAWYGMLIVLANFYEMAPDAMDRLFEVPGDHAGQMETSLLLHVVPQLVELEKAGSGQRKPFTVPGITQPGIWTPRPWASVHPDTGSGDPTGATAEKGRCFFEAVSAALADLLCGLSAAKKGDLPLV